MNRKLFLVYVSITLAGCVNGYKAFYQPLPGATPDRVAATREAPPTGNPIVEHSGLSPDQIVMQYGQAGYAAIGFSSFNGASGAADSGAVAQARAVGADLVVVSNPSYTGTRSSVVPIVTPTSSTSYTSGTATAYGSGGMATVYGSSRTTSYGTQTNFIPVNTDRYDYGAIYLVKQHSLLGVRTRELTPEERSVHQTNRGAVVFLVVRGTPAFRSDILPGDIILAINGETVDGPEEMGKMIEADRGTEARIKIARGDMTIEKSILIAK